LSPEAAVLLTDVNRLAVTPNSAGDGDVEGLRPVGRGGGVGGGDVDLGVGDDGGVVCFESVAVVPGGVARRVEVHAVKGEVGVLEA